ncbi:hypothetical protein ACFXTN_026758 [Malus domestica]
MAASEIRRALSHPPIRHRPLLLSLGFVIYKVDDFATQTKTLAGHNLQPTPWHFFPPKTFTDETLHDRAYKLIHCSYLACRYKSNEVPERRRPPSFRAKAPKCPEFFRWIHHDLEPWAGPGSPLPIWRPPSNTQRFAW